MMEKKNWLNGICLINEEHKNSQIDISWTSSDSDYEGKQLCQLKKVNKERSSKDNWIKPIISSPDESLIIKPIIGNKSSSPDESPLINSCSVQEMSPILTQNSNTSNISSPIIGKRHILKKIRTKYKKNYKNNRMSPDIFESQSTLIIENDTLDFLLPTQISYISPVTSLEIKDSSSQVTIESIPSECSSQVSQYKSIESNSNSLYHQPITKRKRFKKKGLASQLQKVLTLQKTRISIWKHEIYMKKSTDLSQTIEFIVLNINKEYGNIILECNEIKIESEMNNTTNLFLILINRTQNLQFTELNKYKLCSPYESKIVLYDSKKIICFYNRLSAQIQEPNLDKQNFKKKLSLDPELKQTKFNKNDVAVKII